MQFYILSSFSFSLPTEVSLCAAFLICIAFPPGHNSLPYLESFSFAIEISSCAALVIYIASPPCCNSPPYLAYKLILDYRVLQVHALPLKLCDVHAMMAKNCMMFH